MKNYRAEVERIVNERYGDNAKYILRAIESDLDYIDWATKKMRSSEKEEALEFHVRQTIKKADEINETKLTPATAKVGDGATIHFYSDSHAGTIVRVTKATITVQRDKATLDPGFIPQFVLGGFSVHCINQEEQRYTYERDPNGEKYVFYWSDKYNSYGQPGDLKATSGRREFYDYNF